MQSISLVPSTSYNNSLYIAESKNCSNGVIILEDRITDYYMSITGTTAVSIDTSLLHQLPDSTIKFTLIVYSTGNNVLNLSGFGIEQVQVLNGETHFTIMKGVGDSSWIIQMKSSDTRPEMWLRCYRTPFTPEFNTGVFDFFNLKMNEYQGNPGGIFSSTAPEQTTNQAFGAFVKSGNIGEIYAKFPMPVWLKSSCIAVSTNTDLNLSSFPISLQVYGSNDGTSWIQILNTPLTVAYGAVNTYMCTTNNYYTFFRFKFIFDNSAPGFWFPSIALSGFCSELIETGAYSMATPYTTTLPINGYNIETNASEMYSTDGNIYYLCTFPDGWDAYTMTRSTDVPWEYIYTFPEPIRTIGFTYKMSENICIKLFSLSYSDDKENWTEYCKVDGTLEAWNKGLQNNTIASYFYDSCSEHKYYKISVYSSSSGSNSIGFKGLAFLQFQKGHYFTFESFVPKLSSNNQNGYMLLASSTSQGEAYKLFDQSLSTYGGGDISDGEWSLLIQLPESTIVRGLELVAPQSDNYNNYYDRMPYAFSIQGSADNSTWTNIKTILLGSNYWKKSSQIGQWDIENNTAYRYYRLVVTATANGSVVRIGEMGLSSYASFKGVNWYEDEYLTPIMQSESQDGYEITASGYTAGGGDYKPWKAFDRNSNTGWGIIAETAWIKVELPTAKVANTLYIQNFWGGGEQVESFILSASNDDETYTELLSENVSWIDSSSGTYQLENTTAYKYYKVEINRTGSNWMGLREIQLINRIDHTSN